MVATVASAASCTFVPRNGSSTTANRLVFGQRERKGAHPPDFSQIGSRRSGCRRCARSRRQCRPPENHRRGGNTATGCENRQRHGLQERRLSRHSAGDKTDADLRFRSRSFPDSALCKRMKESDCGKSRSESRARPAIFKCCCRQAPHRFNASQIGKKTEEVSFARSSELVEIPSGVGIFGSMQILDVRLRQQAGDVSADCLQRRHPLLTAGGASRSPRQAVPGGSAVCNVLQILAVAAPPQAARPYPRAAAN